ncbi:hypothetical protein TNCV_4446241 [Trichonephila clavipes]|nr:hypothetical protein TNCV_4446241 [Trichonephila clavipes]
MNGLMHAQGFMMWIMESSDHGSEVRGAMAVKLNKTRVSKYDLEKKYMRLKKQVSLLAVRMTYHNHLDDFLRWRAVDKLEAGQSELEVARWVQVA